MFSKNKCLHIAYVDTKLDDASDTSGKSKIRVEGEPKLLGKEAYDSLMDRLTGYDYEPNEIVIVRFDSNNGRYIFKP